MNKVINFRERDFSITQDLKETISSAIFDFAEERTVSNAEVLGVLSLVQAELIENAFED